MNNSKLSKKNVKKFSLKLKKKKTRIYKKVLTKMKGGEMIKVHFNFEKDYKKEDLLMTEYYYNYINGVKLNNTNTDLYFKLPLITSESLDTFLDFIKIPLQITLSITQSNNNQPSQEDIMANLRFRVQKKTALKTQITDFLNQEFTRSDLPLTNEKNILNILYLLDFLGFSPNYRIEDSNYLKNNLILFIKNNIKFAKDYHQNLIDYQILFKKYIES